MKQVHKINNVIECICNNLWYNGINIARIADFNFLGIQLPEDLKWNKHQNKISLKFTETACIRFWGSSRKSLFIP